MTHEIHVRPAGTLVSSPCGLVSFSAPSTHQVTFSRTVRMSSNSSSNKTATILGVGIFFLLVVWAMWHGIIGPRVIEPTPGDPAMAQAPDPDREPPRD